MLKLPIYKEFWARLGSTITKMCSQTQLCVIALAHILTLIPSFVNSKTLESDVQVLKFIKQSIDPASISSTSYISTWDFDIDPCESSGTHFLGILCTIPEDNSSSQVTAIDLEGDGIEGFLTPAIGNLTELNVLNLGRNRFRGPLPSSIFNLNEITRLILSGNFFSGSLSSSISELKKLEIFDLSQNEISDSIPESISGLRGLTRLILSNNQLTGKIPDLSGLWQLKTLDLSNNKLYGNLPIFPASLRTLFLGHNLLSGHITYTGRLLHIRTLDLSDNRLSGTINSEILTLSELSHVNVSANQFVSIEMIKHTNQATQLKVLDASSNRLRGHLPRYLITYGNLTVIHLDHNLFSGRIPTEYGDGVGRSWSRLFLDHNFLEGSLPKEFSSGRRTKGSLARNCLKCPEDVHLCHGGQRPASECLSKKLGDSL